MNTMRPACEISSERLSAPGRRILAEVKVPVDQRFELQVNTWLVEALAPLNLEARFSQRILDSAADAAQRLAACGTALTEALVHLILSGPEGVWGERQTWGFFRIEKLEGLGSGAAESDHSIELYLYIEGS